MADIITVAALNNYVKSLLDSDTILPGMAIRGEITNFVNHYKSGHWYFTLRDEKASVKAVMFRQDTSRLGFVPQEGMRVIVRCRVSLYETTGSFQIYVKDLFPDGIGAAQLALEQLKARLQAEGLFDPAHKVAIPRIPKCIGVVTSATGAALQDIRNVMSRRWPLAHILLAPVNVQGEYAVEEVCTGIHILDNSGKVDVILVARGGGSREDLWIFNDERIARAAYACKTPLISAIGHEIDYCILDFVADLRAPTPSAAAELAVPDGQEILSKLYENFMNIHEYMQNRFELCYNELNDIQNRKNELSPTSICASKQQSLMQLSMEIALAKDGYLQKCEKELKRLAALSYSLNPYAVLERGYTIVKNEKGSNKMVSQLHVGDSILLEGNDANAICRVESVKLKREQKHEEAEKL